MSLLTLRSELMYVILLIYREVLSLHGYWQKGWRTCTCFYWFSIYCIYVTKQLLKNLSDQIKITRVKYIQPKLLVIYSHGKVNTLQWNFTSSLMGVDKRVEMYVILLIFSIVYLRNETVTKKSVGQIWNNVCEVCTTETISNILSW